MTALPFQVYGAEVNGAELAVDPEPLERAGIGRPGRRRDAVLAAGRQLEREGVRSCGAEPERRAAQVGAAGAPEIVIGEAFVSCATEADEKVVEMPALFVTTIWYA